jgi:diguanylate cyclase (GGDEF)-like protein/PAS domain S-box-containing protein
MKIQSFRIKIFTMFVLLALITGFFSIYFLKLKYDESTETSTYILSSEIARKITYLVHAIQNERGLSAAYLTGVNDADFTKRLEHAYPATDEQIRDLERFMTQESRTLVHLRHKMLPHNHVHLAHLQTALKQLSAMRKSVHDHTVALEEMMRYYRRINQALLGMYYGLIQINPGAYAYGIDTYRLERIREFAGLERAYVYYTILLQQYSLQRIAKIRHYIDLQDSEFKTIKTHLTPEAKERFGRTVFSPHFSKPIAQMRQMFFQYRLTREDAPKWFRISTRRINELEQVSAEIMAENQRQMSDRYNRQRRDFRLMLFGAIIAFIVLAVLLYLLNRLLKHLRATMDDLRIASYAFDSHEAMAITDTDATILKINKAFTKITGYSAEEAIGKNPNILKSGRHSREFYQQMWHQLIEKGYWRGEIKNMRKNGEVYDEQLSITAIKDDEGKIIHYISQFLDISELKKAEAEARHQATHDFLTQLPNRSSLLEKLGEENARALRHDFVNAFIFADIDDFKKINDVYGHAAGDKLLREVSHRLRSNVRQEDYVARISGDEFGIILVEIGADEHEASTAARTACTKILNSLDRPYIINEVSVNIGVSLGIKLFPASEQSIEEVVTNADTAMYKAKERGKNRFVFFDHDIEWRVREMAKMESELQKVMDGEEGLVFYYQPKVDVHTQKIVGAELLVRWDHPQRGLLYPDEFLEALENIAMMPRLSEMALENACRFLVEYDDLFHGTLAINVTVKELRTDFFVQTVRSVVERYGIDPSRIELEILENDLIEDFEAVIIKINALREIGVRFAIDDFGVGYSSINYLYRLPIDSLKIDRAFVMRLHEEKTQELLRVILAFAKVFKLKTVLEGIDDMTQLQFAREQGADMYQGYLFSKAVTREAFVALLENERE